MVAAVEQELSLVNHSRMAPSLAWIARTAGTLRPLQLLKLRAFLPSLHPDLNILLISNQPIPHLIFPQRTPSPSSPSPPHRLPFASSNITGEVRRPEYRGSCGSASGLLFGIGKQGLWLLLDGRGEEGQKGVLSNKKIKLGR